MTNPPNESSAYTAGPWSQIGHAGERGAIEMTKRLLENQGILVAVKPSRDSDGDDKIFSIGGIDYTVQVTSIPGAPEFWSEAKQDSTGTVATPQHAASWLHGGIEKKSRGMTDDQRANTILILDAHGWGDRLTKPEIISHLMAPDVNPAQKYRFAGISIAGNSPSNSTWFGGGLR